MCVCVVCVRWNRCFTSNQGFLSSASPGGTLGYSSFSLGWVGGVRDQQVGEYAQSINHGRILLHVTSFITPYSAMHMVSWSPWLLLRYQNCLCWKKKITKVSICWQEPWLSTVIFVFKGKWLFSVGAVMKDEYYSPVMFCIGAGSGGGLVLCTRLSPTRWFGNMQEVPPCCDSTP